MDLPNKNMLFLYHTLPQSTVTARKKKSVTPNILLAIICFACISGGLRELHYFNDLYAHTPSAINIT